MSKLSLTHSLRRWKASVTRQTLFAVGLAVMVVGTSLGDLMEVIPLFAPLVALAYFPFFHGAHDLLALALALYIAYRGFPNLAAWALLLFLAAHAPYLYLESLESLPDIVRMALIVLVGLFGIRLIVRVRQAEGVFRTLTKSSPIGIYIVQDGRFQYLNPQFQQYTGYGEDELSGRDSLGLVVHDDRERVRENAVSMLKGELASPYEYRIITKGGETRWILETVASIPYRGRRASLGNFIDITERKRAEAELQKTEEKYRQLYETAPVMLYTVSRKGILLDCNKAFVEAIGYSKEEIIGKPIYDFETKETRELAPEALEKVAREGSIHGQRDFVARGGNIITVEVDAYLEYDEGRNESVIKTAARDITERKRAEAELRRHTRQLEALHQASQAVAGSLELETVAALALEAALTALGMDAGAIRYFDETTREMVLLCDRGLPQEVAQEVHAAPRQKPGQGLSAAIAQSEEPLIVEDFDRDPRVSYPLMKQAGFQVYVGLPLRVRERVVGTISALSRRQRTLTPSDMEMMTSLGNMVGMAMANAQLFEEQKRRTQELTALHQVSQTVSQSLDMETVSAVALEATLTVLNLDAGLIRYLDEGTQEMVLLCHRGLPEQQEKEILPRIKLGQGLGGRAAQTGETLAVEDLSQDARILVPSLRECFKSAVYFPLKVKDTVVGAIVGFSRTRRTFAPADMEMMGSLGSMVGMAMANARLFEQVEAAGREWQQTFDSMSDGVSILSPDFRIRRANSALARMLDTTPEALVGQYCYETMHGQGEPIQECPLARCIVDKQSCDMVGQEPHLGNRWVHVRADPVLGPQGELLSVAHAVTDITREKQREEGLQRLYNLSQVLSSTLDLDTVLDLALDEVVRTVGEATATTGIALLDEWGRQAEVVAVRGPRQEAIKGLSLSLSAFPQDVLRLLLRDRRPWVVTDISQVPQVVKDLGRLAENQALAVLPLVVGNRPTGVLFIASTRSRLPGPEEIAMLETYAREVALAVENARLYTLTDAALRRRVAELEAITDVAAATTLSLDLNAILKGVLKRAAEALGVERAGVILLDEDGESGVVLDTYQQDSASASGTGLRLEVAAFPVLQKALRDGRAIVIEDTQALPKGRERDLAMEWRVRSALVVPLLVGGRAIGTLQFTTVSKPRGYSREEVGLAQAIAGHLASVIENARLHERTERERGTLESTIASMGEGLVVVDAEGKVAYCNPAAEELLGLNAADFLGQPVQVFNDLLSTRIVEPKGWRGILAAEFGRASGQTKMQLMVQLAERRQIDATLFTIGSNGKLLGTGAVLRDVTHEREMDRMKTEFISMASHELRTPMAVVYGFAQLLLQSKVKPEEQREWLEWIYRESQRLVHIVDDLLNVSRIEMGRLSLNLEAVALEPLLTKLMAQLSPRYPSHSFRSDIPEDFPEVWADVEKLTQVIYNLVDNAAKYSPQGGPVKVSARWGEGEDKAVISVADRGLGIPKAEMHRLFTRFHRVQSTETTGIRGTGLGLYIVKSLVEMMGGRIWAESKIRRGSTFYVALPLAEAALREDS